MSEIEIEPLTPILPNAVQKDALLALARNAFSLVQETLATLPNDHGEKIAQRHAAGIFDYQVSITFSQGAVRVTANVETPDATAPLLAITVAAGEREIGH